MRASSLQLLASRVAAAVAREARGGSSITRAASTSPAAAAAAAAGAASSAAAAAAATAAPPPPIVTVRGLDAADGTTTTAATAARRAESVALLRRLNVAALPELRGQTVLARVVRASRHELLLDPGYYGLCAVPREGVMPAAAPGAASAAADEAGGGGDAAAGPSSPHQSSNSPSQVRVGDYVRVRLSELHTPYGDPQLDPVRTPRAARDKLVLRELARRMRQGAPVAGRVLNACAGGYAVGVGGYVALLRTEQAPAEVVRAVGVLQPFYVHKMSRGGASKPGATDADAGGRRRGRRGAAAAADAQRPLIELTCTIQRAGGGGGGGGGGGDGSGGLYSNV